MADEARRDDAGRQPIPERQGVREPQPLERKPARDETDDRERKVGDRAAGERNDERAPDEPASGPRAPQEPRTSHVEE